MTNNTILVQICAADIRSRMPIAALEDKVVAAFRISQSFWLSADDHIRFQGALAAVLSSLALDEPDYARLIRSIELVRWLADLAHGDITKPSPVTDDVIPLLKLWSEAVTAGSLA